MRFFQGFSVVDSIRIFSSSSFYAGIGDFTAYEIPTHGVGKISVKNNEDDDMCYGEYYVSVYDLEWR